MHTPRLGSADEVKRLLEYVENGDAHWISRVSASEAAAELIRNAIFRGNLRPGDQIPFDQIIDAMSVSRLPVREAINVLKHEGLVRVEPHRGSFVGPFNEEVIREHWTILGLLHGHAAHEVAERGDSTALARLEEIAGQIVASRSAAEVGWLSFEYRRALNLAGGTERLRAIMRPMSHFVPARLFLDIEALPEVSRRGASEVTACIAQREADEAAMACRRWAAAEGDSVVAYLQMAGVITGS